MHFASIQIRFEHWLPVWFGGSQCRSKGKERFWQGSAKVFWPQILNFKLNIVSSARCEAYSHGWESTFCCQQFDFFRDPTSGGLYHVSRMKIVKEIWKPIRFQATVEELGVIHTKLEQSHKEPSAQSYPLPGMISKWGCLFSWSLRESLSFISEGLRSCRQEHSSERVPLRFGWEEFGDAGLFIFDAGNPI